MYTTIYNIAEVDRHVQTYFINSIQSFEVTCMEALLLHMVVYKRSFSLYGLIT